MIGAASVVSIRPRRSERTGSRNAERECVYWSLSLFRRVRCNLCRVVAVTAAPTSDHVRCVHLPVFASARTVCCNEVQRCPRCLSQLVAGLLSLLSLSSPRFQPPPGKPQCHGAQSLSALVGSVAQRRTSHQQVPAPVAQRGGEANEEESTERDSAGRGSRDATSSALTHAPRTAHGFVSLAQCTQPQHNAARHNKRPTHTEHLTSLHSSSSRHHAQSVHAPHRMLRTALRRTFSFLCGA